MRETVTLELPELVIRRAREIARSTQERLEDVPAAWLDEAAERLPDEFEEHDSFWNGSGLTALPEQQGVKPVVAADSLRGEF